MNLFTKGPSTILYVRSIRLATAKMEELHELLTNWVRKLSNSEVQDESPKEMWITREKVTVYQESGGYTNLMAPSGFLCDAGVEKIGLQNDFQIAIESANLQGNLSLKDTNQEVLALGLRAIGSQPKPKEVQKQFRKIVYGDAPRKKIKMQSKEGFANYISVSSGQQDEEIVVPKIEELQDMQVTSSQWMDHFEQEPVDAEQMESEMSFFEQELRRRSDEIELSARVSQNEISEQDQLLNKDFSSWGRENEDEIHSSPYSRLQVKQEASAETPPASNTNDNLRPGTEFPLQIQTSLLVIKEEQREQDEEAIDDLSFEINLQKNETRENYFGNDETELAEEPPFKDELYVKKNPKLERQSPLQQDDKKQEEKIESAIRNDKQFVEGANDGFLKGLSEDSEDFDFGIDNQNSLILKRPEMPASSKEFTEKDKTKERKKYRMDSQEERKILTLEHEEEENDFEGFELSVDNNFYLDPSKKKSFTRLHGALDQGESMSIGADQLTS